MNTEFDPSVTPETAAYNLLEFQYLIKERGHCKRETFQECLNRYGKQIPEVDKCPGVSSSGPCNKEEK